MGYYTNYSDEIAIEPPLSWAELQEVPQFCVGDYGYSDRDVKLRVVDEKVNTSEGLLIKRTATHIEPSSEDSYKGYSIVEHVQELVDKFGKSHAFTGYINAEGEEAGDLWRLYVIEGNATKVEPEIIWPVVPEPTVTWPDVQDKVSYI